MDIYGLYSYGQTWTSSTIQNNRTSMVYGYSHGSPEIVKQQAEKKKKQKKKKESNIFFDFLDDIGDAIVETGKKAVDTVVDVGKYVGEKVVEYAPTVGTFIVENAPVLSNIKSGADFLFGVDVLTGERLSSTDRTLAFFGTFTGGGVKNLAESGFKNGSKFLNNLTPTVTRNVNKGTNKVKGMPPIVQSRINVSNDGWKHVLDRHFSNKNASQFTIKQSELRSLLTSKSIVNSPVIRSMDSADGVRYVREVTLGNPIGLDKFNNFKPTSTMTILTDKHGNLVTATPGRIK